jgi:hypothetical protein
MTALKKDYGPASRNWSPLFLKLWTLRDEGHAIYDGEECAVSGNWVTCEECAFLSANVG